MRAQVIERWYVSTVQGLWTETELLQWLSYAKDCKAQQVVCSIQAILEEWQSSSDVVRVQNFIQHHAIFNVPQDMYPDEMLAQRIEHELLTVNVAEVIELVYCSHCTVVTVSNCGQYCEMCISDITAWLYKADVEYLLQTARKEEDMRYGA